MTRSTPTTLDYALLGLLHQSPRSGYDLRKVFETTAMGNYSGSPGAIYPALRRLERQDLVVGEVDATEALRPRKVFRPTRAGRNTLSEWVLRPIEHEDVERRIDELMLRFAFHWVLDSRMETRRFLQRLSRQVEAYLNELNNQYELVSKTSPPHSRLALEAGIDQYRAIAQWARKAIKEFPEEDS